MFHRRLVFEASDPICIAGIGEVATLPDHQGKGYSSVLMRHVMNSQLVKEKDAVILHCRPDLIRFYERFGFREYFEGITSFGYVQDLLWENYDGGDIELALFEWEDNDQLTFLNKSFSRNGKFTVERNLSYWKSWIRVDCEAKARSIFMISRDKGWVGYVVVAKVLEEVSVLELRINQDDNEAYIRVVLNELCRLYQVDAFNVHGIGLQGMRIEKNHGWLAHILNDKISIKDTLMEKIDSF